MKKSLGILLLALGVIAWAQTPTPSAQTLLQRTLQARGGAARFAAIRTLVTSGYLTLPGGHAKFLVRQQAPNLFRIDLSLPQGTLVQAYDGRRAWQIDPGSTQPHWLTGPAAKQIEDQALGFIDMAIAPERVHTQVASAGAGTLRGHAYQAVHFTLATGDQFTQYFDATTGLQFFEEYPGGTETVGDYRRIGGLLFPFLYVNAPDSPHPVRLQRESIQLNQPLDPALFRFPAPADPPAKPNPLAPLEPFIGNWTCDGQFRNGKPTSARVVIAPALGGAWLRMQWRDQPPSRFHAVEWWGYDPAGKTLVNYIFDNFGGARRFTAPAGPRQSIDLVWARPHERFVLHPQPPREFRITWQIQRQPSGPWLTGDWLQCKEQ